jgi:MFS family permease
MAYFKKANTDFLGIYQFLERERAKFLLGKGYAFVNGEQDLGIDNLRKAKMSWRPVKLLKKYIIRRDSSPDEHRDRNDIHMRRPNNNVRLYYLLTALTSAWFITSNWVYFWTRFMTFGRLGWIDGVSFGFALLLDIPTGALADLIGRKRAIQLAMMAACLGSLGVATSGTILGIFWGWMVVQVGLALFSGSADALVYDSLVQSDQQDNYDQIASKAGSISLVTDAICTLVGGLLFVLHFRLPYAAMALTYALGFWVSCGLVEPTIKSTVFSAQVYLATIRRGITTLFQPPLSHYVPFFFTLLGVYYLFAMGFVRPAMAEHFGFHATAQSILLPIFSLLGAALLPRLPLIRSRMSDRAGLTWLSLLMGGAFLLAALPVGSGGVVSLLIISLAGKLAYPWISTVVNNTIAGESRATTLSALSLVTKLPYVLMAVLAGNAVEQGLFGWFCVGVGLVVIGVGTVQMVTTVSE